MQRHAKIPTIVGHFQDYVAKCIPGSELIDNIIIPMNCCEIQALALWVHEYPGIVLGIAPRLAVTKPKARIDAAFGISEGWRMKPKIPIQDHAIFLSVTW